MPNRRIAIALVLGLSACSAPKPGPELFAHAETLCLDEKWDEAPEPLREYLLAHPDHAGAHFYLGRAYLFGEDFRPAVAEGELQLALKLYIDGGRKSPIDRFPDEYFEIICNIESSKVLIKLIPLLLDEGVPISATQDLIRRMRIYLERARAIQPDIPEVKDLNGIVITFEQLAGMEQ